MKRKILRSILLIMVFLAFYACRDEDLMPAPDINDPSIIGAVTLVTSNPDRLFFNALNPLDAEYIEFELDINDFGVTEVVSVDVELVFTDKDRVWDPLRQEYHDSIHTAINVGSITSFPSTFQLTGQQVADAVGFGTVDSLAVGDLFQLTFPINTGDGRRLTVALNSDLCNEPAQPSFGGCSFIWGVSCPSELNGVEVNYVINSSTSFGIDLMPLITTSGTLTWQENGGAGVYDWDTFTFGAYQALYGCCEQVRGGTALRVTDVCSKLSISAEDGFACPWSLTVVSVNGAEMNIILDGGEVCLGIIDVTMTRTDGLDWPVTP